MSTVERFGDYVIKLGTEGYRAWSQNDLFCLKFQHYGVRSSFLVDMTTGETEKIMLVPTLFACAVSNDGKLVSFADKDGNIWLLDRASNKIIKLVNCFSKYSLSKDSIIEYLFFLEGHNKIEFHQLSLFL